MTVTLHEHVAQVLRSARTVLGMDDGRSREELLDAALTLACARIVEVEDDHLAIARDRDRVVGQLASLAGLVLEHLDAPTPESAAELRTVATHGRRRR